MDGRDEIERIRKRRLQFGKGRFPNFSKIRERLKNGQMINRKMLVNRKAECKPNNTTEKKVDLRPPTRKHLKTRQQLTSTKRKVTDITKGRKRLSDQKGNKKRRKKLEKLKKKQEIFGTKIKK